METILFRTTKQTRMHLKLFNVTDIRIKSSQILSSLQRRHSGSHYFVNEQQVTSDYMTEKKKNKQILKHHSDKSLKNK